MDFLTEVVALGVDIFILAVCVKEYQRYKNTVSRLKVAPQLPLNSELKFQLNKLDDKKLEYAAIRGTVTPIGPPMRSVMSPSVTGVLQVIKMSEHRLARGYSGFWTEQRKTVHVSTNEMPFMISNGEVGVEIIDGISASVLDLDVVYDNYEPTTLSFLDHIFGFFSGLRQKGMQTTEEVLRDGSVITAIGEIELDGNTIRMQASPVGPLFLTTATKSTIIKKLEEVKSSLSIKIFACGAISVVLMGIIARKYYIKRKRERDERKIRESLEKERRERRVRARVQTTNLTEDQLCVVCSTSPKEVIILPCGHVCICEDCSLQIGSMCPVCRGKIDTKAAAFIS